MATSFPRFLTIEEAAQRLGVSVARISMWIGECKLPVAARSEYAGFLLRALTVETVGHELTEGVSPDARIAPTPATECPIDTEHRPNGSRCVTRRHRAMPSAQRA